MNILKFQISLENKQLNNLLTSKTELNTPLIYESAYYILIYHKEELIGISKNYFFNYPADILRFADFVLEKEINTKDFNKIAIHYSLWIKPGYRDLSIGSDLFRRTLSEFKLRNIDFMYTVSQKNTLDFYYSVLESEGVVINNFHDNNKYYISSKFDISNLIT